MFINGITEIAIGIDYLRNTAIFDLDPDNDTDPIENRIS